MSAIKFECPKCDHAELAHIGPTIRISGEVSVTVTEIKCSKCGYEGKP